MTITLDKEQISIEMHDFWGSQLRIENDEAGFVIAMPIMDACGWQISVHLQQLTPSCWELSDKGRSLGQLELDGKYIDSGKLKEKITNQCHFYGIERNGYELKKIIEMPFEPSELQIFTEGLCAISHLLPKLNPDVKPDIHSYIDQQVSNYFYQRSYSAQRNYNLKGSLEDKITVDFYIDRERPLALQTISRKNKVKDYMEQWGWRWMDLKAANPSLIKAMVFDPHNQVWDATSLRIGEKTCDIFTPYDEADEALDAVMKN